jgi:hypothetical protein
MQCPAWLDQGTLTHTSAHAHVHAHTTTSSTNMNMGSAFCLHLNTIELQSGYRLRDYLMNGRAHKARDESCVCCACILLEMYERMLQAETYA